MLSPDQARIHAFEVVPSLPDSLKPLMGIAQNLWWSWHPEAVELFVRLDRGLWQATHHNPVAVLGMCPQETLDTMSRDEGFLNSLERVQANLDRHMKRTPWHLRKSLEASDWTVAYFCAEFGLTECFQIYSGGLGCLAGDHLKSASELGLPLVAVGLLYRNGYFQQYLNADGWQQEYQPELDFPNLPVHRVLKDDGSQVTVTVQLPGRDVTVAVWEATVGRIRLFLLDTNLPANDLPDRDITSQLYGGDMELRIKQEIVLGIGGVRALTAVGIEPDVCHMNEGHSAFLALERIRVLIEKYDLSFDEARQYAAASNVFTTHTPVPAGIDRFPPDMIQRYFRSYHPSLRLDMEGLLALGRENVFSKSEFFSMAVLALRTADSVNGVSKLHGEVSRSMWKNIWPAVPEDEVPIGHVTNGVHARSWLSSDLINLLDRYLGSRWQNDPSDQGVWATINDLPDEELWRIHSLRRQRLIVWARRKLRQSMESRGDDPTHIQRTVDALAPDALTIGFARRFATYKRGTLLLHDIKRIEKLLGSTDRPIQFLIAGKAHPADGGGKELIRQIVRFARESNAGHRIVFIENYDIGVARYLVQGCDVWLNTPRRGMEASGTSGMKAAINGVPNCSILDGWWDEAYQTEVGWAIGRREAYANPDTQDRIESEALYQLLENQIVPMFYDRDEFGIPRKWVKLMKQCISTLAPVFNTNRMVQEYTEKFYLPALRRSRRMSADRLKGSVEFAHRKARLRHHWGSLRIERVDASQGKPLNVHGEIAVSAVVRLGELSPDEVRVQSYVGSLDNAGNIVRGKAADLKHVESLGNGAHRFAGATTISSSGRYGLAVRVVPGGELFQGVNEPGLILWESFEQRAGTAARAQVPTTL
jgi:starch phosphorylase